MDNDIDLQYEFRKWYVLGQNLTKMTLKYNLLQISAKCIIPDINDLDNYGQCHNASLSKQMD